MIIFTHADNSDLLLGEFCQFIVHLFFKINSTNYSSHFLERVSTKLTVKKIYFPIQIRVHMDQGRKNPGTKNDGTLGNDSGECRSFHCLSTVSYRVYCALFVSKTHCKSKVRTIHGG